MAGSGVVVVEEKLASDAGGLRVVGGARGLVEEVVAVLPFRSAESESVQPRRLRVVRRFRRALTADSG